MVSRLRSSNGDNVEAAMVTQGGSSSPPRSMRCQSRAAAACCLVAAFVTLAMKLPLSLVSTPLQAPPPPPSAFSSPRPRSPDFLNNLGGHRRPHSGPHFPEPAVVYDRSAPIPRHIYLTARRSTAAIDERIQAIAAMHPGFNVSFFDDRAARRFLRSPPLGSPFELTFLRLRIGPQRADFLRYCLLYVRGGIYLDVDNWPQVPLTALLERDADFVSALHVGSNKAYDGDVQFKAKAIHNGILVARAGSPLLLHLMQHMMAHPQPEKTSWAPLPYHFFIRYFYVHLVSSLGVPELFPNTTYTLRHHPNQQEHQQLMLQGIVEERVVLLDTNSSEIVYGRPPKREPAQPFAPLVMAEYDVPKLPFDVHTKVIRRAGMYARRNNSKPWASTGRMNPTTAVARTPLVNDALRVPRCVPRNVWTKTPTREQAVSGRTEPRYVARRSCSYETNEADIAVGVFHCLSHEKGRIADLRSTWGGRNDSVQVAFMASAVAQGQTSLPNSSMIYTAAKKDDYGSTLEKGLLGLRGLVEKFPDAKWYMVLGDDVFLDAPNMAHALSAFNPDEEWCLAQCNAMSFGAERMVGGTYWRIFGGAPIITSRALTHRLVPFLSSYNDLLKTKQGINIPHHAHDLHFTKIMQLEGGGPHRITHLDGIYSLASGPYLGCPEGRSKPQNIPPTEPTCPRERRFLPKGTMQPWPAAIHQVRSGPYMTWHGALFKQVHVCNAVAAAAAAATVDDARKAEVGRSAVVFGVSSSEYGHVTRKGWGRDVNVVQLPEEWKHPGQAPPGNELLAAHPNASWYVIVADGMYVNHIGLRALLDGLGPLEGGAVSIIGDIASLNKTGYILSRSFMELIVGGITTSESSDGTSDEETIREHASAESLFISTLNGEDKDKKAVKRNVIVTDAFIPHPRIPRRKQIPQKWSQEVPRICAAMFSTNVDLRQLEWGYRESPRSLAHLVLGAAGTSSGGGRGWRYRGGLQGPVVPRRS